MDIAFDFGGVLISVALQAEFDWRGSDQFYPGDVFACSDFMTTGTACGNGRVYGFAFRFVFVTLDAGGGISVLVQRHRVLLSDG
jgi:hypothetical protein